MLLRTFEAWINLYPTVQDMITTQRAVKAIETVGSLLVALDAERKFYSQKTWKIFNGFKKCKKGKGRN